jgi:glycosyltransferase involved in cell wall biosynthesis
VSGSENSDITVVIPCFNYGAYVREAVDSVLAQDGGPAQIVVVDDGSTDPGTTRSLDSLPDGVHVMRRENGGPAAARNSGAAETDTPYLLMLDADDKLAPGALASLRSPLDSDPQLGYSYGLIEFFGEWSGRLSFPDYDPYRLLYRPIVGATSLVRRSVWDDIGGFDAKVRGYEDWDFYLSALVRGWRGRRVPHVALLYRRHRGSKLDIDRSAYRRGYRIIRRKHRDLYKRARDLARESELGAPGRLFYRTYFAWRPVPGRVEQGLYAFFFR